MCKYNLQDLLYLINKLRDKEDGCPWDVKQTFETLIQYTKEETCEVIEAIDKKDYQNLKEELGDLLMHILLYSQIAKEMELFDFNDVIHELVIKIIRRHPHIFPDSNLYTNKASIKITEEELALQWQRIKKEEKKC